MLFVFLATASFILHRRLPQKQKHITFSTLIRIVWIKVTGSFGDGRLSTYITIFMERSIDYNFCHTFQTPFISSNENEAHAHNNSKERTGEKYNAHLGFFAKKRGTHKPVRLLDTRLTKSRREKIGTQAIF